MAVERRARCRRRRCSRELNELGGRHGVGRVDLVENRYVGMKSRGVYETPGGTILHAAHRAVESITLDREVMHLRDALIPRYAEMVYYGYWFAPERDDAAGRDRRVAARASPARRASSSTRATCTVAGRKCARSLYDPSIATFEDGRRSTARPTPRASSALNACGCASGRWSKRARRDEQPRRRACRRGQPQARGQRTLRRRRRRRSSRRSPPRFRSTAASYPYDIAGSIAHARMLGAAAHHPARATRRASSRGLARDPPRDRRAARSARSRTTRTSTWRSSGA